MKILAFNSLPRPEQLNVESPLNSWDYFTKLCGQPIANTKVVLINSRGNNYKGI